MVKHNNVMKRYPVGVPAYPKRFTRAGDAYEYSTEPQTDIPAALWAAFKAIVPEDVPLGLYSRVGDDETDGRVEVTNAEDRSHRRVPYPRHPRRHHLHRLGQWR